MSVTLDQGCTDKLATGILPCEARDWLGRIVGGDSGCGQIAELLIRDFPAAITIARLCDGRVLADSDLATSLLGCSSPRIGIPISCRWTARRDHDAFMVRFVASGRIDGLEIRLQKNDGMQFTCSVSARLIEVDNQQFMLFCMADLSDQIAARNEISRQRDALHDAEKLSALGQLLGGISHELNNPLSVLAGQALMLREKAADEGIAIRADRILKAAEQCSRIVRSFLDLARGEPVDGIHVNLNEVVIAAIEATISTLRGERIEPVLELPADLPQPICDPDQIRQVIINLITNARQALSGRQGPLRIAIRTRFDAENGCLVLKVCDNGPGVPSEISSRIFDPLFTTKPPGEGSGLGLSLCRRIMEAHDGSIGLEQTSARGSIFTLTFRRLARSTEVRPVFRKRRQDRGGLSVLVFDDNHDAGTALAENLAVHGHGVEMVQSIFVGAELIRKHWFDVIFYRVGLADSDLLNGLRTIDEARSGASGSVIFVVDQKLDGTALDALERFERPYVQDSANHQEICEVMELLTLRRCA